MTLRIPPLRPRRSTQRGLSLVELMVGILIGMFVVLIILQLLYTTSAQQRQATTGGDAQINGTIASYVLTHELAQAGLGISSFLVLGCNLSYTTTDGASVTLQGLAPITVNPATTVVPAGDANTDTLLVIGGNGVGPSEGDATTAISSATGYTVATPAAFNVGDFVMAAPLTRDGTTACPLAMGSISAIAASVLTVSKGTASLPIGSAVYDLGAAPSIHAYAVRNGNLTMCDYVAYDCSSAGHVAPLDGSVWVPVVSNVVSLRAEYGRDTTDIATPRMDGAIDSWDQITPGSAADTSGVPANCGWLRVVGLRLAIVARSQQYDKTAPTQTAPVWSGTTANTATSATLLTVTPTALPIDLSGNGEWRNYRYKVVETTVPLRNVIWNGSQVTYQNGSFKC